MDNLNSLLPSVIRHLAILTNELQRLDEVLHGRSSEAQISIQTPEFASVKPDRYRGERAIDAAIAYLKENPRRVHIPLSQIVDALVQGGADHGKPRRPNDTPAALISHTLKIGIPNRHPETLDWEPKEINRKTGKLIVRKRVPNSKIMVWLTDMADEPKRRRRATVRRKDGRPSRDSETAPEKGHAPQATQ